MKTLFISSFHSLIARNILSSGVLNELAGKSDFRIVIFVPDYKKEYFKKYFERENVIIEGVKSDFFFFSDKLFGWLASSLINTTSLRLHKEEQLLKTRNYIRYFFSRVLAICLGKNKFAKKFVRFLDYTLMDKRFFEEYFKEYNPNLLFITDMFLPSDLKLLAAAKMRNIPTIGMVRSWDNITNKGLMRLVPDKLLVHNRSIKEEAAIHEMISPKNIFVTGIPQFDEYLTGARPSRENFFRKIGADLNKRLIVFAPYGNRFHDTDWQVLQMLKENKELGLVPSDVQFFVRFPPGDDVSLGDFIPSKDFIIDRPGISFKEGTFNNREMTQDDSQRLADALFHSELAINYASTISIDAAIFDKPIILITFDGWEKRAYLRGVKRFYDYEHMEAITRSNCARAANSKEELILWINKYLENPTIDREGRKKLVRDQLCYLDGKSGERIAKLLYENLLLK